MDGETTTIDSAMSYCSRRLFRYMLYVVSRELPSGRLLFLLPGFSHNAFQIEKPGELMFESETELRRNSPDNMVFIFTFVFTQANVLPWKDLFTAHM